MAQSKINKTYRIKAEAVTPSEDSIQQSCVNFWEMQYPKYKFLLHHSANEGKRQVRIIRGRRVCTGGLRLQAMGMKKGYPDIQIDIARGPYHGMRIELKKKDGRLSPEQKMMLELLAQQGYYCCVCYSVEDFRKCVKFYMELE